MLLGMAPFGIPQQSGASGMTLSVLNKYHDRTTLFSRGIKDCFKAFPAIEKSPPLSYNRTRLKRKQVGVLHEPVAVFHIKAFFLPGAANRGRTIGSLLPRR